MSGVEPADRPPSQLLVRDALLVALGTTIPSPALDDHGAALRAEFGTS